MKYIIFDLEATCWLGSPPVGHNEIIEIGAFEVNAYGEVISQFSRYVKPVLNPILSSFCTKLTSIQQYNVDTADKFDVVIEDFMDWVNLDSEYYLISWGENDKKMLRMDCEYHGFDTEWLDQCVNLKVSYSLLTNQNKHKGTSLKKALEKEEIEFEGKHHRAIYDADNLTKLFIKHFDNWPLLI